MRTSNPWAYEAGRDPHMISRFRRADGPPGPSHFRSGYWKSMARTWIGIVAAFAAAIAAVWLLSVYIHARRVDPVEKALVDSLKAKARTDAEVQKVLQPELNRQHESLVRRRNAYRRGGIALLLSVGISLAWFRWFRPRRGDWVGVPAGMLQYLEKASDLSVGTATRRHPIYPCLLYTSDAADE